MTRLWGTLLLLTLVGVPRWATGQEKEREPPKLVLSEDSGAVTLHIGQLLEEEGLQEALHSGLPLRIRIVTELWLDRLFDSQEGKAEWRATLAYDALEQRYHLRESANPERDRSFTSLKSAASALQGSFQAPLRPKRPGRHYYLAVIEIETLSLSDIEELQRWLRGDLAEAVAKKQKVEGAVKRGLRRLFVRLLRLPTKRIHLRTPLFEAKGVGGGSGSENDASEASHLEPPNRQRLDAIDVGEDSDPRSVGELKLTVH